MEKRKLIAIALAVAMTTAMFAGCSGENTPSSSESSSVAETPAEPTKATGVVKEMSMNELVVTLEDGSDITLKVDGLEGLDSIALGDTVEVEYTEGEDGAVASSVKAAEAEAEDTENPSADEEQATTPDAQAPASSTTGSSEAQAPASSTSGSQSAGTQSTAPAAQTSAKNTSGMTQKERAAALMEPLNLEIVDWTTPANELTAGMNQLIFSCSDFNNSGTILAYIAGGTMDNDDLKTYGYDYPQAANLGWVKAFNDYRGVETDVVVYGGLDDSLENWYGYQYDEASDSFEEVLIPVGGNGSTTSNSNEAENTSKEDTPSKNEQSEANSTGDVYEAIDLINAERVKAGLSELEVDERLMNAAQTRAEECDSVGSLYVDGKAHTRPDGSEWKTVFAEYGVESTKRAENCGQGKTTAKDQVESWMDSSGHKANILNADVTHIGVGYSDGFWVMLAAKI